MADQDAHLSQPPHIPPLCISHEDFSDDMPLMALSPRTVDGPLPNTSSNDVDLNPNTEDVAAESTVPSETDTRGSTTMPPGTTIPPRSDPSVFNLSTYLRQKYLRPVTVISNAIDLRVRKSRFHGWRMGVLFGCCMSFFVLCCNVGLIVLGATRKTGYGREGLATLIEGDEELVSRWNTALHVLINALSTLLLSTSNYTMQVLSSPTRDDVDAAHAKGRWLDIGLLSSRNLRSIPRRRAALWLALALSSIPLHLFYNASIFKVITARNDFNIITMDISSDEWRTIQNQTDNSTWTGGNYSMLSPRQWDAVYRREHNSVNGDVYLAINYVSFSSSRFPLNSILSQISSEDLHTTTLANRTTLPNFINGTSDLLTVTVSPEFKLVSPFSTGISLHVAQVSSKKENTPSTIQISLYFLIVVVCFNSFKLIILLSVLITDRSAYLVTLGDAASSFLKRSDAYTDGICVLGREEILSSMGKSTYDRYYSDEEAEALRARLKGLWLQRPRPYYHKFGPSHPDVKISAFILFTVSVILISTTPSWVTTSGNWKWGAASNSFVYSSESGSTVATLWSAWLANAPQLLLSCCYFMINLICTSMGGAVEWNKLATSRKGLRVTKPYGQQRSTYFLQLPYRWSLPLTAVSGILHWLMSQTFFLVRIDTLAKYTDTVTTSACGFSITSLIVLLSVFGALLLTIGIIGLRKMDAKIPIAASCSLAISAACHPPPGDVDAHLAKVQWGVTQNEVVTGFGHCSLSSKPVTEPEEGRTYH